MAARHRSLRFGRGFRVALSNVRAQAAAMTIAPGDSEASPENRHFGADQWLYVVEGSGRALVNGRRVRLSAGSLLLIERGDRHQIENNGDVPLRTLNLYVPPAYRSDGTTLPRGRRSPRSKRSED